VKIDSIAADEHRFESFGLGARGESNGVRVRHAAVYR